MKQFGWSESRSPILVALLAIVTIAGCKYDGSFMQFNSDSPSPFLGFQLAVRSDPSRRDLLGGPRHGSAAVGQTVDLRESAELPKSFPAERTGTVRFTILPDPADASSASAVSRRLNGF